jgi:hypothetical protein
MSIYPFNLRGGAPVIPVSWDQRLDFADSESEVIEMAREFLAQLDHYEISQLPSSCRPRKLFDANDISDYAFDLLREECDDQRAAVLVHKLAVFFAHASNRLSQLLRQVNDEDGEEFRQSA